MKATLLALSAGLVLAMGGYAAGLTDTNIRAINGTKISGSTLPISGTITASMSSNATVDLNRVAGTSTAVGAGTTNSGTQRVVLPTDQSAIPVTGTFWQTTQPVSVASLPLPTGAATESTLSALSGKLPSTLDGSGYLKVAVQSTPVTSQLPTALDGSGYLKTHEQGTATVSGTITANAGTGTFAISAASLPLPSGAATAAKQPALGTAGTPSSDVLTVQGATSMTALKVDGSAVTQPVSGTLTTNPTPTTSGGLSTSPFIAAGSTNATSLKGSAGQLYGYYIVNNNASTTISTLR